MIVLSTPTFDIDGFVVLHEDGNTDTDARTRRVSRTATLDGGVVLTDSGFSHGDRTFNISVAGVTKALYDSLAHLQENYPEIIIATAEGMFTGAIQSLSQSRGTMRVSILINDKITE